jgi:Pescadillo N-terminus
MLQYYDTAKSVHAVWLLGACMQTYSAPERLSFGGHRQQHAYEKKIRKAKAKRNADLAQQLAERRPTYTLDRLIKER